MHQPLYISALFVSNTTIVLDSTVTLEVTNAPTVIVTELTQYSSRSPTFSRYVAPYAPTLPSTLLARPRYSHAIAPATRTEIVPP